MSTNADKKVLVGLYGSAHPSETGERSASILVIGERGRLTRKAAGNAAREYQRLASLYPTTPMYVCIHGYDDDAREMWQIPNGALKDVDPDEVSVAAQPVKH
jgi:hypothetical protein